MLKLINTVFLLLLLSGCASISTNAPEAIVNSLVFGGEVSFVHDPENLVKEDLNKKIRKEIEKIKYPL